MNPPPSRLRLLMVTPYLPRWPDSGTQIRLWQQIRHLARQHDLTVASLSQIGPEPGPLAEVCRLRVFPIAEDEPADPGLPDSVAFYQNAALHRFLQAEPVFDAAFFELLYTAPYLDSCRARRSILCEHNIESELFRQHQAVATTGAERLRWRAAALRLQAYEERVWGRFDVRVTVSEEDRTRLQQRCPQRTVVVPNGADCSQPLRCLDPNSPRFLFVGNLAYRPNQDAVRFLLEQAMPALWETWPEARLVVAGKDLPDELRNLSADPRLEWRANPPRIEPLVDTCRAMLAPLRMGSGTRIKVLEALAWGLPVLASPLACEGLEVEDGRHVLLAEGLEEFLAGVERLADRQIWEGLRQHGRRLVEERYDWKRCFARLEAELPDAAAP